MGRSWTDETDPQTAELRKQYDRLRRSVVLFRDLVGLTETTAVLRALLHGIASEFPVSLGLVGRVNPHSGRIDIVARTTDGAETPAVLPIDHPIIARLLSSAHASLLLEGRASGLVSPTSQSLLGVRFRLDRDAPDLLLLESEEPGAFSADDLHFVKDLLQTLEATLLNRFSRSRADREFDLLMEVTRGPTDLTHDLDEAELSSLLQKILQISLSLTRCRTGAVLLVDEETGDLHVEAETFSARRSKGVPRILKRRADRPNGVVFRVVEDNRPYLANDSQRDLHYLPVFKDTRASLGVPISFQNRCIGVILVEATEAGHFTPDHQRLLENLAATAASFIRRAQLYAATRAKRGAGVLIKGRGPAWAEVERRIERASATTATVCLRGESGTGKELVANAIHFNSERSKEPLVVVNCAAIPAELLESEFFGHVRGAFTGAVADRAGSFESAEGGTIFLDEIGDLPPQLQVKLLRVLQSGEIRKVGSDKPRRVNVRIIAATSRNLETMMGQSRFREDLYYRLMVVPMYLPPLREYPRSIPSMVQQFLRDANIAYARSLVGTSGDVMRALRSHQYPGNVRELRNIIEQAVLMADDPQIEMKDLPAYFRGEAPAPPMPGAFRSGRAVAPTPAPAPDAAREVDLTFDGDSWGYKELKEQVLRKFEGRYLDALLATTGGNVTRAAELAGVHRVNVHRMIKRRDQAREGTDEQ